MLNEMDLLASVAEKSFTGIETSPKETLSDAIDRAAMVLRLQEGARAARRAAKDFPF